MRGARRHKRPGRLNAGTTTKLWGNSFTESFIAVLPVSLTHPGTSRNLKLPPRTGRITFHPLGNVTSSTCRSGSDYPQRRGIGERIRDRDVANRRARESVEDA